MPALHGPVGRVLRLASLVAFFATLPIYSPNVMVVQAYDASGLTGYFAEACLVCALVFCIAVAMAGGAGEKVLRRLRALLSSVLWCVPYVVGTSVFAVATLVQPSFGRILNTVCALCCGASVLPVCILWGRSLADFDLRRAVLAVACAGGCSAIVNSVLSYAPPSLSCAAVVAASVAGMAWPLCATRASSEALRPDGAPCDGEIRPVRSRAGVKAFLSVMGVPLLGMAIASFAMGVQPLTLFGGSIDAQRAGMVVGSLALLPFALFGARRPVYTFVYQVYLPAAAAFVLVLCAFPADTWMRDVALVGTYAFYAMVCGVAVAVTVVAANAREFPRSFVFSVLIGVFCALAILGIFLGARIARLVSNNAVVLVVLTTLYGVWLMLSGCLASWRLTVGTDVEKGTDLPNARAVRTGERQGKAGESFDERVERLSAEAGLSPREREIVQYIGRGHSSVYVAKTLLISESTVYTHVRNIYRKFGVSSREELIHLLNA